MNHRDAMTDLIDVYARDNEDDLKDLADGCDATPPVSASPADKTSGTDRPTRRDPEPPAPLTPAGDAAAEPESAIAHRSGRVTELAEGDPWHVAYRLVCAAEKGMVDAQRMLPRLEWAADAGAIKWRLTLLRRRIEDV